MGFRPRVEVMLPALLNSVAQGGLLSIEDVARITAENPARIWGLYPKKGCIGVGSDADLVVVDLNREMAIRNESVQSAALWTLYDGMSFRGRPPRRSFAAVWPVPGPTMLINPLTQKHLLARISVVLQRRDPTGRTGGPLLSDTSHAAYREDARRVKPFAAPCGTTLSRTRSSNLSMLLDTADNCHQERGLLCWSST